MKGLNRLHGLNDLKTAISAHARTTPRRSEMNFLEAYLLQREEQRLSEEMARLQKRADQISRRLDGIRKGLQWLSAGAPVPAAPGGRRHVPAEAEGVNKMTIGY